jgi:hypothetical protein
MKYLRSPRRVMSHALHVFYPLLLLSRTVDFIQDFSALKLPAHINLQGAWLRSGLFALAWFGRIRVAPLAM